VTRQTWTALVAAACFVALAALIATVPVPYVTWSPSATYDTLGTVQGRAGTGEPIVRITGIQTYPTTGRLDLTTVAVTRAGTGLSLPEAVAAYWLPHRDALPRDSVYAPGKSVDQVAAEEAEMMETAQDDAVVAALRAARQPVQEMPVVSSVSVGAPAHDQLEPGDLIVSVGGVKVTRVDDVGTQIRRHDVGDRVPFVVIRKGVTTTVNVVTASAANQAGVPVVGITVGIGYRYQPQISFDVGQQLGGPSAGLVFALAIYDKITPGPLLAGRHVAATGTIDPNGAVGPIGGIQQKIAGAQSAGATVFFVPADNCKDLAGVHTSMTLVKVASLSGAIAATRALDADPAGLPHC
jgi:Lon-like protease